jgi:Kef-type K+ transport system membrane component KefB
VALEGGPHRLSDQVSGVANGFLVPVFFVVLGAGLDVRALVRSPGQLELAAALTLGMVLVHILAALVSLAVCATGIALARRSSAGQ